MKDIPGKGRSYPCKTKAMGARERGKDLEEGKQGGIKRKLDGK